MQTTKAQISLHICSLIKDFVVHCLDSIISLVSIFAISWLLLASVAEQAGLSLTWSKNPDDRFSLGGAHMFIGCIVMHVSAWLDTGAQVSIFPSA